MKTIVFFIVIIFSVSSYAQDIQLNWQNDLPTAIELSKIENKPILLYFTKDDCKPCLQFYTDIFKSEMFKEIANNFVYLLVDNSNQDIKNTDINVIKQRRYSLHFNKTNATPALMVLDQNGDVISDIMVNSDQESVLTYFNNLKEITH